MGQSFTCLHYHIVFSTAHRQATIQPVIQQRLYEYFGGIIRAKKGALIASGGMADHIHLLARLHAQTAVSDLMRELKSNSSGWIHDTFPAFGSFAWQTGYAAFSVSYSNLDQVRTYIENQAEHHLGIDFKLELVSLLDRHEIPYDPRYLFD
jgi:putative transposase